MPIKKVKILDQHDLENQAEMPSPAEESAPEDAADYQTELSRAQELISQLEAELARQKDLYLRAHAQMENLKKRTAKEKEDFAKYSQETLLLSFLPVVDNLERALEASPAEADNQNAQALREGVALILKQFLEALEKAGVKPVEALELPFDPHFHHAVMQVETAETPEGTVVEVLQKGYILKDRLLRPAMVKVATKPSSE